MRNILLIITLIFAQSLYAKRLAPKEVKPLVHNGIEYTAIKWGYKRNIKQNGGILEAKDIKTKKVLWTKLVYKIDYDKNLEQDVQDKFITKIALSDKKDYLIITNEARKRFKVNLKTGESQPILDKKK